MSHARKYKAYEQAEGLTSSQEELVPQGSVNTETEFAPTGGQLTNLKTGVKGHSHPRLAETGGDGAEGANYASHMLAGYNAQHGSKR